MTVNVALSDDEAVEGGELLGLYAGAVRAVSRLYIDGTSLYIGCHLYIGARRQPSGGRGDRASVVPAACGLACAQAGFHRMQGGAIVCSGGCHRMQWKLQPCAVEAAIVCSGGCHRMQWRLPSYAVEAAIICSEGCHRMPWRL